MIDEVAKILDLLGKRIVDCLLLELAGVIDGLEHQEVPFGLFSRIEIRCVTLWPRSRRIGKSLALRSCGHPWPAAQFLIVRSVTLRSRDSGARSEERRVGKGCEVRVDLGGRVILKKKK